MHCPRHPWAALALGSAVAGLLCLVASLGWIQPSQPDSSVPSWCSFGSYGAYWSAAKPEQPRHWHIFQPDCQLRDLLPQFSAAKASASSIGSDQAGSDAPGTTDLEASIMFLSDSVDRYILTYMCQLAGGEVMLMDSDGKPQRPLQQQQEQQPAAGGGPNQRHLLSPQELAEGFSADMATELEEQVQRVRQAGPQHTEAGRPGLTSLTTKCTSARRSLRREAAATKQEAPTGGQIQAPASAAAGTSMQGGAPQSNTEAGGSSPSQGGSAAAGSGSRGAGTGGGTVGNSTEAVLPRFYMPHVCWKPAVQGLRLLATYLPGVHPIGPFHKGVHDSWHGQVASAAQVWRQVYPERPPDVVVVASSLWDLARMSAYEPHLMAGHELPPSVLEAWIANYTRLVQGVRRILPDAPLLAYHTTMAPRYNVTTGLMDRAYLGRRFFITQLNAAGRHAAAQLGLEVVDYAAVANRFMEGQTYLWDAIHPNRLVGLEIANLYLNYAVQARRFTRDSPKWRHPSTYTGQRRELTQLLPASLSWLQPSKSSQPSDGTHSST